MSKQCQVCLSPEKQKLLVCQNCFKQVCKFCKPTPDQLCVSCIRSQIREELITESLSRKKALNQEILDLMDSTQHIQLELELLSDKFSYLENFLRSSNLSHLEKVNNIEKSIESAKKDIIPYSTIDNLELVVEGIKKSEKEKKKKFLELVDLVEAEENNFESLKKLEKLSQDRINELRTLSNNCVPYEDIRGMVCESCSKAVKKRFKELILSGNSGNESIMKSIVSYSTSGSVKSDLVGNIRSSEVLSKNGKGGRKQPTNEGCHCLVW